MSVSTSRVPSLRRAAAPNRDSIMTASAGVCMILLAHLVLDGTIAGVFGVWGISLVDVAASGYLLLRLWGACNRPPRLSH